VQTTRFPVKGVAMVGEAQIILVDTPGVFKPRRRLDRAMVRSAWAGAEDADIVVHLVDAKAELAAADGTAKGADRLAAEDTASIVDGLKKAGRQAILALNKIDLIRRDSLLALSQRMFDSGAYSEAFMISAKDGSGVDDLKTRLAVAMPGSPWLYPPDQAGDLPARLLAAEITREKVYLRLHEELPYAAAVETTAFTEARKGAVRIEQTIYVERDSQRPIVLGKGGQTLKWIGEASRTEIGEILGQTAHLFLTVKVRENWADEREFYSGTGLDFDV
jgi:GTP-binding protein Era